jgi:hypothetical protein
VTGLFFIGLAWRRLSPSCIIRLEIGQRVKFIVGKFKDLVKADYAEDALGSRRKIAENKTMTAINEQLSQAKQTRNARGGHYVNGAEIHNDVTVAAVADDFCKRFNLASHPRLAGQVNKNYIIRPVLKTHFYSP